MHSNNYNIVFNDSLQHHGEMYDYLIHHGVKGQQWGVKHGPPYPIDYDNYRTLVKRGNTLHRISARDESEEKGMAYATFYKKDNDHFKGFFSKQLLRGSHGLDSAEKVFDITLEAAQDLLSPSYKERLDTFVEMMNDEDFNLSKKLAEYEGTYINGNDRSIPAISRGLQFISEKTRYTSKKAEKDSYGNGIQYKTFTRSLGAPDGKVRQEYFKRLSDKGFNMVVDDYDRKISYGSQPIIVFNRDGTLKYVGQRELSKDEINAAVSRNTFRMTNDKKFGGHVQSKTSRWN